MAVTVLGEVEHVTFENEETGFRVVRLGSLSTSSGSAGSGQLFQAARQGSESEADLRGKKHITIVGVMPQVRPGTRVRVSGRLETDKRHGDRLRADSVVIVAPETLEGIEKYLASGVIRGIGPVFANRIVKFFGLETLRVLDSEPHRLAEVPGLGKARVEEVRAAWVEHQAMSNVLLVLQKHGATPALAGRIIRHFGEKATQVVQQTPYRLAIEVSGVGFKTADRMAQAVGLPKDDPQRIEAGVLHEMRVAADSGHCACELGVLCARASAMLGVSEEKARSAVFSLCASEHLVTFGEVVQLRALADAEKEVAERVASLLKAPAHRVTSAEKLIADFEREQHIVLAEAQREAVLLALREKVLVVTGGPGVGKTTLVRAILAVFAPQNLRVRLAAPTGRAAKRLTESTGKKASTLHRLLEVEGGAGTFARNEQNPLEVDLLIVDEASMIDIQLAKSLLRAVPNAARVLFVGDADQLPSVGPGALLHDLIASSCVPVARLDVIFRQAGQSGIVENSHLILRGQAPVGASDPEADFFVIKCSDGEKAAERILELVTERIPQRFGLDPLRDIQVLTPMHKGTTGTIHLNRLLQERLNPEGVGVTVGDVELRVGDKVLQTKNDYERGVFNGDLGEVISSSEKEGSLSVQFEAEEGARAVTCEKAQLHQLSLAYATTIHKSQGSEYPAVVIPLLSAHYVMLSRNLLYTAVTRAKRLCVLVADERAMKIALSETRREERLTQLQSRLKQEFSGTKSAE